MASCCAVLFILLFAFAYFLYAILFTYIAGVNRSMKRYFQISDCGIGWLYAAAGLTYAVVVMITAYFGGRGSRPARCVATGFLVVVLGCVLLLISAFVAPLPLVEDPKDEQRFWKDAFTPLTMEDIITSKALANTAVAKRFPADVRKYLADRNDTVEGNRKRRSAPLPIQDALMLGRAFDRLRRDVYLENVEENEIPSGRRLTKRELPDWEFPDDLKERLTAGFTGAVFGFYYMEWDTYQKFADRLYNLSNDPEIAQRIMKASRLPFGYCRNASSIVKGKLKEDECKQKSHGATTVVALIMAFIGFGLIGIGSTPIWTVAISLLDDMINKFNLATVLAGIFALHCVSILVGAAISLLFEFKVYANFSPSSWLTPIDPRWVGAWWLGFVIIAVLLLIPAIPLLCINPRRLVGHMNSYNRAPSRENDQSLVRAGIVGELGTWKRFGYSIFEVSRPPIFVALLLALTFDALSLKGYFDFLPKFFENNYSPSIWKSALPFWLYSCGIVMGGLVFRFSRLDGRKAAFYIVVCTMIASALSLGQSHSFFSCTNAVRSVQEAGLVNSTNGRPNWPSCRGCICDRAEFYPVCANNSESTPYYSPCHAGCTNFTYEIVRTNVEFYFDYCYCSPATRMRVSRDSCKDDCSRPTRIYLTLSCLAALLSGSVIVPVILFVLRSVMYELRSLALAVIGLSVCVFGFLPSALIYRFIADSTCFLWRNSCPESADQNPTCEIFDGPLLRERLHLFLGVLRLLSVLFYGLVSFHAKDVKLYVKADEGAFETEMRVSPHKEDRSADYVAVGTNNLIGKM